MSEDQAPYLTIQDNQDEILFSTLTNQRIRKEIIRALRIINEDYKGTGRIFVEYRGGSVFLIGQESVRVMNKR